MYTFINFKAGNPFSAKVVNPAVIIPENNTYYSMNNYSLNAGMLFNYILHFTSYYSIYFAS